MGNRFTKNEQINIAAQVEQHANKISQLNIVSLIVAILILFIGIYWAIKCYTRHIKKHVREQCTRTRQAIELKV